MRHGRKVLLGVLGPGCVHRGGVGVLLLLCLFGLILYQGALRFRREKWQRQNLPELPALLQSLVLFFSNTIQDCCCLSNVDILRSIGSSMCSGLVCYSILCMWLPSATCWRPLDHIPVLCLVIILCYDPITYLPQLQSVATLIN